MDQYNRALYTPGSVRFYYNYDKSRHTSTITLLGRQSNAYLTSDMEYLGIYVPSISTIGLGPRTAITLYENDNLEGPPYIMVNDSPADELLLVPPVKSFGSFALYTFDKFIKVTYEKKCSTDKECNDSEYCICPNGFDDIRFCEKSGKRCFNKSKYLQNDKNYTNPNYPPSPFFKLVEGFGDFRGDYVILLIVLIIIGVIVWA